MRDALKRYLLRLASEVDALMWEQLPPDDGERSLDEVADWGRADDWSDWADPAG